MTRYSSGRNAENYLKHKFRDKGYTAQRQRLSKPIDLFVGKLFVVEVKKQEMSQAAVDREWEKLLSRLRTPDGERSKARILLPCYNEENEFDIIMSKSLRIDPVFIYKDGHLYRDKPEGALL